MINKPFRFLSLLLLVGILFTGALFAEPVSASGSFGKKTPASGASFSLADIEKALGARFWWLYAGNFPHEYCISTVNGSCNTEWVNTEGKMYVYYKDLNLQPGTTYYWQVRALIYGEYIYADNNTWWNFTVLADSAPTAFVKVSPANGVSFHRADFKDKYGARLWWKSAGATTHEVCFVQSPAVCDPNNAALWEDTNGKLYKYIDPFSLDVGGVYRWHVRAISNGQYVYAEDNSNAVWSFTILSDPAPTGFGKVSPGNAIEFSRGYFKDKLGSRFWWKAAGSVPHEFCLSTTPADCANGSADVNWTDTNGKLYFYLDALDLQVGSTYAWHVRALINEQYVYSDAGPWSFKVVADDAPTGFGKSSPGKDVNISRGDFLNKSGSRLWWNSAGAVPYEVCFVKNPATCDPANPSLWRDTNGKLYDYHDHMSLDIDSTYTWHVRAIINGQYIYADNIAWQFTIVNDVAPAALKKTSPASGLEFSYRDIDQKLNAGRFWWGSAGDVPHEYCFSTTNDVCTGGWVDASQKNYVHYDDLQLNPGNAGTVFYWQVRAFVNGQYMEADGGTWWSFKLMP
jgi:hypothetical protein